MLKDTAADVKMLKTALFDVPAGSPPDERPLIEGLRVVWRQYQRGSWAARVMIWMIPTMASIGAAVATIRGWVPWVK